eukprot:GEMP01107915.1.p2 GENE.GEMP01107915.1~~GEMP01107915.1.p2  ORF type:complete len:128 (+),score=28.07 GEMP01107915.1:128-511(+)
MSKGESDASIKNLGDIPPLPEYAAESTIVAVGFPQGTQAIHVGTFFSWIAPVMHVQRIDASVRDEVNFLVVFVNAISRKRVMIMELEYAEDSMAEVGEVDLMELLGVNLKHRIHCKLPVKPGGCQSQ